MRKGIVCLLLISMHLSLCACSGDVKTITCDEVVAAYEAAGYAPVHKHPSEGYDYDCYIRVEDMEKDEEIMLYFFSSAEAAESRAEERQFNVLLWLFTVIYGKPQWLHTTSYNNIEVEYVGSAIYEPFEKLTR